MNCILKDVDELFSENEGSDELMLSELSDTDMITAANKLQNNEVSSSFTTLFLI